MKKKIEINKLEEGMILGEDIISFDGILILNEGKILNKIQINKIKKNTDYRELLIKLKEEGEIKEWHIADEKIVPLKPRRIEIKKKLKELEKEVESTLVIIANNPKDRRCKEELHKRTEEIKKNIKVNMDLLQELVSIKSMDKYLYVHSLNVGVLSYVIGTWMGLGKKELEILIKAGILHDIGKLRIDPNILYKKGKLTVEEFEEMKKHTIYTYKILKENGEIDEEILKAVIFHHEKEDGAGYPLGLTSEKIPLYSKIITVADIFDAMTSERVYKNRVSPFKVIEMFQNEFFGKLDNSITFLFIRKFSEYFIGAKVLLNNGEKAEIISLNNFELTKPLVRLKDKNFIDISKERNVEIVDVL